MNSEQSTLSFENTWDKLITQYVENSNDENEGLLTTFEEGFYSPCYSKLDHTATSTESDFKQGEKITWKPFLRPTQVSLNNLESALDIVIPKELHQLFCRYFSHDINAKAQYGSLTILQALNEADFDRLQKNLIAHVLMKRRLKQQDTLFFALTDEEDFILSVDLSTQAVVLEEVGREPKKQISPNLTSFFATLIPQPQLVEL